MSTNQFMLTPFIGDEIEKNNKVLSVLSDLMSIAIKKAEQYDNVNAKTHKVTYKTVDDMNIFTDNIQENFSCDTTCGKNINKSMFEREETKYLLFTISTLFLCVIVFRK